MPLLFLSVEHPFPFVLEGSIQGSLPLAPPGLGQSPFPCVPTTWFLHNTHHTLNSRFHFTYTSSQAISYGPSVSFISVIPDLSTVSGT